MPPQQQPNAVQTKVIDNFGGRLTRVVNGDLNSGMAKFSQSWGYDPFTKPGNLTWLPGVQNVTGNTTDLILAGKLRFETDSINYLYAVGNTGNLYKIQPASETNINLNNASVIGKITNNSPTFKYGASMETYGLPTASTLGLYIGSDTQVNSVQFDGSGDAKVGSAGYIANTYRPLKKFVGKLYFGNGNTVGAIDSTGTVTSSVIGTGLGNLYSELDPPLPPDKRVHDMSVSMDGNYLMMAASSIGYERIADVNDNLITSNVGEGEVNSWNGVDKTITAANSMGNSPVSAIKAYLNANIFFTNDTFGTALSDGINKLLTLPNNKPPLPNAVAVNGNFITWACSELDSFNRLCASVYYFGALDQDNPPGLYRITRIFAANGTAGFMYQVPFNTVISGTSRVTNTTASSVMSASYGKHYLSTLELTSGAGGNVSSVLALQQLTISGDTTSNVQGGTYETQTQLFGKKITVKQVRIYTEPTVANSGVSLSLIGSDGNALTNGTFSYSYTAGTDSTLLQGSLERIDWNPACKDTYALGIQISNNGNSNMTIKKIEIDYVQSGK
jgi:hypothetical protein